MLSLKKVLLFFVLFVTAYCLWIVVRPAKIIRTDHNAVFVENVPVTDNGKIHWWFKNRMLLQNTWHVPDRPDNFTVIVMNFGGYEKLPNGTRDGSIDDYTCFANKSGEPTDCVCNSIAFIVRGSLNGKIFINIDDRVYLQSGSDKAVPYKSTPGLVK